MTKVNLHGKLGKIFGETWQLEVKSVSEALRAIEANTGKLRKWFMDYKDEFDYQVLVNDVPLSYNGGPITLENYTKSDIFIEFNDTLKQIDIVPIITGSGSTFRKVAAFAGSAVMFAAAFVFPPAAPFLIAAGLALGAAGVTMMLSKPPPLVPYQDQQATTSKQAAIGGAAGGSGPISYLFNGPINTIGEGGPVPVGYGELLIGSHNICTNYDVIYSANYRDINPFSLAETQKGWQFLFNEHAMLINQKPTTSNF